MTTDRRFVRSLRRGIALLTCVALAACGGGGDDGGGQIAGIEGTGIVSGFGSVWVNGIEFETDDAEIVFNGEPVGEDALRVGDIVTVRGTIEDDRAEADRIVFDRVLDGPISRIEVRNGVGRLVALGETVHIDTDTRLINTPADELAAGDLIAVSGVAADDGDLRATSIEQGPTYRPDSTRIDIEGRVRDLAADRFYIGPLEIDYGGATVDLAAGELKDGAFVQVFGTQGAAADAPLVADSVIVRSRGPASDSGHVFRTGRIENFDGPGDFTIAGQRIDAQDASRNDDASIDPAEGVFAWVYGTMRDNVLVADTLTVRPDPNVVIEARIRDIDEANDALTLLSVDVRTRSDTLYVDERDAADRRLRFDGLARGNSVRISGYATDTGVTATRVTRVDSATTRTRGPVASVSGSGDALSLEVAGIPVIARDDVTEFEDADGERLDAAAFRTRAEDGAIVEATGPDNDGRIDTARTLRLIEH
ncbi:DUF5666 domain-containing protein [Salinisphaera orenii]|uniref:DUF5666 domain-containing protein n=1 Tax=Salinisphaera orenii YIM 95161 TaxID=1051139 RepID=A0A423PS57_9GAMM|nr:DUF5666 domain-containing protein [Salinisphaera halophila]ROO28430.1 hypothetical protein SAHL_10165 [Salinisphaera halophila YIM 95161]